MNSGQNKKIKDKIYLKRYGLVDKDIVSSNSDFHFQYVNEQIFKDLTFLDRCIFTVLLMSIDWEDENPLTVEVSNKYISRNLGWTFSSEEEDQVSFWVSQIINRIDQKDNIVYYDCKTNKWRKGRIILSASGNTSLSQVVFNPQFTTHFEKLYERAGLKNKDFSIILESNAISSRISEGLRLEERLKIFRTPDVYSYKQFFLLDEIKSLIGFDKAISRDFFINILEDINENSLLVRILKYRDGSFYKEIKQDNGKIIGYELRWRIEESKSLKGEIDNKFYTETNLLRHEYDKGKELWEKTFRSNPTEDIPNLSKDLDLIESFCQTWTCKGCEDADDHIFWIEILSKVFGVKNPTERIKFQKKVFVNGHTKKIDAYIPETKVLIEQKSYGVSLDKKILQSDGVWLTPYEQAKRYNDNLPASEKAFWIIVSNFSEIWVYDMDKFKPEKHIVKFPISDLLHYPHLLDFLLLNTKEEPHHA